MKSYIILSASLFACFAPCATAEPPKLLSTSPHFWATNVSPTNQKTISITFDQRLRGTLTDWVGLDVMSPPSSLHTTYTADHMSCSIDARLEPGKVYVCALNERGIPGVGFQNEKGLSLPATYLVFQTTGAPAPDDAPPRTTTTLPPNDSQLVDSSKVRSVTIAFDRPMDIAKHGLHMTENKNPVDLSKTRFQYSSDGKTFALAYDFKPSSTYEFQLNSTTNIGFSSAKHVPLWPARLAFTTAPAP